MDSSNDSSNVSFGKPNALGALYVAPKGTAVPTNATTPLANTFKGLGYVSEDGLVNNTETDTEDVFAWGGDNVLSAQTNFAEMFTFNLIETNIETAKLYYGEDNVEVDGENITIKANSAPLPEIVFVAEIVMTGGRIKRIVVERGQIVDRSGEITYVDGEAVAYPIVLKAFPDADGNTHVEYIAKVGS